MRTLMIAAAMLAFAGCTWVEPDAQGKRIDVAYGKNLSACAQKGTVTVSVRHKIGFYERNDLKVRDELESLARNEATELGGDTVQALGEPVDGEQKFGAYDCR
ncbi:MAG: DUF4156 domain-containing protein [Pseudomonadota bacterium]|nr:DUF4156 domain-containing protein [Pseudomonadota bacterium]